LSKILELSTFNYKTCEDLYPDDDIILYNPMHNDEIVPLPFKDGEFQGIWMHHFFNKVSWRWSGPFLVECVRVLASENDALLHVIVPSIKWISKQFWQEALDPHVKPILFGEQTSEFDIGRNAFTMLELRIMFDQAGLAVIKAKVGAMEIQVEDEVYQAEQLYVAGVKNEISNRDLELPTVPPEEQT
jgi:hypothetical protein